jgi:hypothetical protein
MGEHAHKDNKLFDLKFNEVTILKGSICKPLNQRQLALTRNFAQHC